MTVNTTTKQGQWGNANVQVKEHPRQYKTGRVVVPTYSAQCPDSNRRKRLKKKYGSVYEMECGTSNIEVDIDSGNYVVGVTFMVNSLVPSETQVITAADFELATRKEGQLVDGVYGPSNDQRRCNGLSQ